MSELEAVGICFKLWGWRVSSLSGHNFKSQNLSPIHQWLVKLEMTSETENWSKNINVGKITELRKECANTKAQYVFNLLLHPLCDICRLPGRHGARENPAAWRRERGGEAVIPMMVCWLVTPTRRRRTASERSCVLPWKILPARYQSWIYHLPTSFDNIYPLL